MLGDFVIASAILNQLLHHSHMLNIRGESYRLLEKWQPNCSHLYNTCALLLRTCLQSIQD